MYRNTREKIKTYILLTLIVTSIIQVGILWDYQNHGFPTNFLTPIFNRINSVTANSPEKARQKYFAPYRIVICNGGESHWLIDRKEDVFSDLWDEGMYYLSSVLSLKPTATLPLDRWGSIITRKSIAYEFKSSIDINLLKWFLNNNSSESRNRAEQTPLDGIYKIAFTPWENVNQTFNTVYIMDEHKIYKYSIEFNPKGKARKEYGELNDMLMQSSKYALREYRVAEELDPSRKMELVDRDILFVVTGPRHRSFKSLSWYVPDKLSSLVDMADIVLGNEKSTFNRSRDIYDDIVFKTIDNIYRIYDDGLLEYKYIPGSLEGDRGEIGDAFLQAFRFINGIEKHLVSGVDIYLSGVKRHEDIYEFIFDYMAGEIPVVMDLERGTKNNRPIRNAIVIKANGKRIVECTWIMRHFQQSSEAHNYNVYFEDLTSDTNITHLDIDDIVFSYVVNSTEANDQGPYWVIERLSGDLMLKPMRRKGES